jgi:hypothetical protein
MAEIWYLVTSFTYVPHIVGSVFWPVRFLLPVCRRAGVSYKWALAHSSSCLFYLETNLSKSISAHCLNIERGRYNKPKIPREERFCKFCAEVETEEHFLISCNKYKDIRKTFFQSYGLDLKDSHNTYFLLSKLLNPKHIIECNYL